MVSHDAAASVVFSGDTLFCGGPGATGRSYSDEPTILRSIRDILLAHVANADLRRLDARAVGGLAGLQFLLEVGPGVAGRLTPRVDGLADTLDPGLHACARFVESGLELALRIAHPVLGRTLHLERTLALTRPIQHRAIVQQQRQRIRLQ